MIPVCFMPCTIGIPATPFHCGLACTRGKQAAQGCLLAFAGRHSLNISGGEAKLSYMTPQHPMHMCMMGGASVQRGGGGLPHAELAVQHHKTLAALHTGPELCDTVKPSLLQPSSHSRAKCAPRKCAHMCSLLGLCMAGVTRGCPTPNRYG